MICLQYHLTKDLDILDLSEPDATNYILNTKFNFSALIKSHSLCRIKQYNYTHFNFIMNVILVAPY